MPGGSTTSRLLILCTPASYQLVNDTLRNVDPTSTGDNVSAALALVATPKVKAAFVGSWALENETSQALRAAVRDAGWQPKITVEEATALTSLDGLSPSLTTGRRMWLFDATTVTFEDVLTHFGLRSWDYNP